MPQPVPPTNAPEASSGARRCRRMHGADKQCLRDSLPGTRYCDLHTCPVCKLEKQSSATACPACAEYTGNPTAEPPPVVAPANVKPDAPTTQCARHGENGRCVGTPKSNSQFCSAHCCPVCRLEKPSTAKTCTAHAKPTGPPPPCEVHQWLEVNVGSMWRTCAVCDKKVMGVKGMKCKQCDAKAHRKCITSTPTPANEPIASTEEPITPSED